MNQASRRNNRSNEQLRPIKFTPNFQKGPLSSVLVEYGDTKVICSVSFSLGVPKFLKGTETGWLTAEYSMLPSATSERVSRESSKGKPSGRTMEIQRLIGRTLRNSVNLESLGENTLTIDCDVIQADGGTRTASITGASVALKFALDQLTEKKKIPAKTSPFLHFSSAVSIGVVYNSILVDLDYIEDSHAEADMNFVMNESDEFLEIQASAEDKAIKHADFTQALELAKNSCQQILEKQKEVFAQS